jgi:hypothetical protein
MTTYNKDFKVKNGLSVGGDIDLTGTVDGRDIAVDGTKLDGVDSGANNYTLPSTLPSSMLTGALPAIDGSALTNLPSTTGVFPFYKANGTQDNIVLDAGALPFYKADGTQDNIGLA